MDAEVQKNLLFNKLEKISELDSKTQEAHKRFNTAIIKLLDAKNSVTGLKYLDPEFYLPQAASTLVSTESNNLHLHRGNKENHTLLQHEDGAKVLDKPFMYIDTYAKDVALMRQLQSHFASVLDGYIEYANYRAQLLSRKHK